MRNNPGISRQIYNTLIECARRMRNNPTEVEALLWERLRKKQLFGFKFRRQHIIKVFIVDFYCSACKLVVEIDGPIHKSQLDYDREREEVLRSMGYRILRFTNRAVIKDIDSVLATISRTLLVE